MTQTHSAVLARIERASEKHVSERERYSARAMNDACIALATLCMQRMQRERASNDLTSQHDTLTLTSLILDDAASYAASTLVETLDYFVTSARLVAALYDESETHFTALLARRNVAVFALARDARDEMNNLCTSEERADKSVARRFVERAQRSRELRMYLAD